MQSKTELQRRAGLGAYRDQLSKAGDSRCIEGLAQLLVPPGFLHHTVTDTGATCHGDSSGQQLQSQLTFGGGAATVERWFGGGSGCPGVGVGPAFMCVANVLRP